MSELILLNKDDVEEFDDIGSFNHSTVQANLAYLLKRTGRYTVSVELSLDSSSLDSATYNVKDEMIPDVCIYPNQKYGSQDAVSGHAFTTQHCESFVRESVHDVRVKRRLTIATPPIFRPNDGR